MPFITFDGGEGVGKSTQMRLLQERLPAVYADRKFVFTREPGGTPLGEKIRSLIFQADDADGLTMFGLFMASRADHVRRVIIPAVETGKVVISDRFAAASWAYQLCAQESPIPEALFDAHLESLRIFPDLIIIFDMEPEEALRRLASRYSESTHFDLRDLAFHHSLRSGFKRFAEKYGTHRIITIDASQDIETVYKEVLRLIEQVLL